MLNASSAQYRSLSRANLPIAGITSYTVQLAAVYIAFMLNYPHCTCTNLTPLGDSIIKNKLTQFENVLNN